MNAALTLDSFLVEALNFAPESRLELADAFGNRQGHAAFFIKRVGQFRVFNGQPRQASGFQFFNAAHDRERIAKAMIGIEEEGQRCRARNATRLFRQFRQRDDDEIRRTQNDKRRHRACHEQTFIADLFGRAS